MGTGRWMVAAGALLMLTARADAEPPATPALSRLPPAIAARVPPGGFLIASADYPIGGERFVIARVDASGATELVHEMTSPTAMGWVDRRTLVTVWLDHVTGDTIVRRYVDGRLDGAATLTIPPTEWLLPEGKTPEDLDIPALLFGKAGALWLERCHTKVATCETFGTCGGMVCAPSGSTWLRIDGKLVSSSRPPRGIRHPSRDSPRTTTFGDGLPKPIRAPKGYSVKLRNVTVEVGHWECCPDGPPAEPVTVKGFSCTGPRGASTRWPQRDVMDWDTIRTKRVRWLHATPPLFAVDYVVRDIHDERYDWTSVFRACEPDAFEEFVWLGDGRWAQMRSVVDDAGVITGTRWTFHVDDVAIGSVDASESDTLIAPVR